MKIKVDIYTKHYGIYTVELDESDIEELALSRFIEQASYKDYDSVLIDKVET